MGRTADIRRPGTTAPARSGAAVGRAALPMPSSTSAPLSDAAHGATRRAARTPAQPLAEHANRDH